MNDFKVTENFSFYELTDTSHKDLLDKNREYAMTVKENLYLTAIMLQNIRDMLGKPMTVSSGVRCPELNKKVGGKPTSRHQSGLAADTQIKCMTAQQFFDWLLEHKTELNEYIHKAIVEGVKGKEWVHLQTRTATDTKPTEFYATKDGVAFTRIA